MHAFLDGRNAVPGQVVDGRQVSPLGSLLLPRPTANGAGHLVIRQEALHLTGPRESTADTVGAVRAVDCNGVLLTADVASTAGDLVPGALVGVVLPLAQRHIVPSARDADVQTRGDVAPTVRMKA